MNSTGEKTKSKKKTIVFICLWVAYAKAHILDTFSRVCVCMYVCVCVCACARVCVYSTQTHVVILIYSPVVTEDSLYLTKQIKMPDRKQRVTFILLNVTDQNNMYSIKFIFIFSLIQQIH